MVERHLQRLGGTELLHHQMRSAFMTGRPETLDLFLHQYGKTPLPPPSLTHAHTHKRFAHAHAHAHARAHAHQSMLISWICNNCVWFASINIS